MKLETVRGCNYETRKQREEAHKRKVNKRKSTKKGRGV